MDFLKKNWEKILLGVVLVGLAVAVAFLPLKISSEKADLEARRTILDPKVKELPPVEFGSAQANLARAAQPMTIDFSTGHRLFNPVLWKKSADGSAIKVTTGREVGPDAVVILKTTPLYTILSLDNVMTNASDGSLRFLVGVDRQAAEKPADRRKITMPVAKDTKAPLFTLVGTKETEKGIQLTLELADSSGERVVVSKDAPFRRIDGYLAELRYPPENRTWPPRRKGDFMSFGGENYNIVAINENEVVLSAPSGKKTTVRMMDSNR